MISQLLLFLGFAHGRGDKLLLNLHYGVKLHKEIHYGANCYEIFTTVLKR